MGSPWTEDRKKSHAEKIRKRHSEGKYANAHLPWSEERKAIASRRMTKMIADGSHPGPPRMVGEENPNFGKPCSEVQKQRIRQANTGREPTPEARKRMGDAHRGKRVHSEEFKQALAERNRTRSFSHSEESKAKISASNVWRIKKGDWRYLGRATTRFGEIGFRSLWELRALELMNSDMSIRSLEYEKFSVLYEWQDQQRRTVPDFRIIDCSGRTSVIEVKPRGFTYNAKERAKMSAAQRYCAEHGWAYEVWDERRLWDVSCPRESWVCSLPTIFRSQGMKSSLQTA